MLAHSQATLINEKLATKRDLKDLELRLTLRQGHQHACGLIFALIAPIF